MLRLFCLSERLTCSIHPANKPYQHDVEQPQKNLTAKSAVWLCGAVSISKSKPSRCSLVEAALTRPHATVCHIFTERIFLSLWPMLCRRFETNRITFAFSTATLQIMLTTNEAVFYALIFRKRRRPKLKPSLAGYTTKSCPLFTQLVHTTFKGAQIIQNFLNKIMPKWDLQAH